MPDIIPAGKQIVKSSLDSVYEPLVQAAASTDDNLPVKAHGRNDPNLKQHRFGVQSAKGSDNCFDLLHNAELSDIGQYFMDKKESIYNSRQKKPLGRAPSKANDLPEKVFHQKFRFGSISEEGESMDKILFPEEGADFYRKSDSGEFSHLDKDRRRLSNGCSIDPESYRFGAPANGSEDTAADLLAPKRSLLIGMRRREDHKAAHQHVVGRSGRPSKPLRELTDHAFGLPSKSAKEEQNWGAKECLSGYSLHDDAFGESRPKANYCDMIAAGTPSIQTDRKPPRIRSLANTINYGDCPRAHELLYPPKFSSNGIMDSDFSDQRRLDDLRQLFNGAGMEVTDIEFDQIKRRLDSSIYSDILSYQKAYNQVKNIS